MYYIEVVSNGTLFIWYFINWLRSSMAKGTQTQQLHHTPITSLMKDQLDYRNSENFQFYQACSCKAKSKNTVVNGTCYHQLYLQVQIISIQQIPWRTSNACITWLNRDAVVSNDNGHYLLNFSCLAQQFKIYWEQKIEIFHLKWILCCPLDYTAQGGQANRPPPQLHT
jgi:hypothetical protein